MLDKRTLRPSSILFGLAIAVYIAIVLGIILTVVVNSLSIRWYSGVLPKEWTLDWYKFVAGEHDIPKLMRTTFIVAFADVFLALLISYPAAYALARHDFKGKAFLMALFMLPMIVPPMAYGMPLAMLCYKARLASRVIGVVLVNLVPIVPFMILVLTPFIEQVSVNLESAAKMLGAKRLTIFRKVLIPLTVPGILTAGLLSLVKSISLFELTYLIAGGGNQTIGVALYADGYAAGARPPQAVDALAVIYFLISFTCLVLSLKFVSPTQMVFKVK